MLVGKATYERMLKKRQGLERELARLSTVRVSADGEKPTLRELLKRPENTYLDIEAISPPDIELCPEAKEQVELEVKYEGYIKRQTGEYRTFAEVR